MKPLRTIDGAGLMAVLVFAISAAVTVCWCGSMAGMPGMEMPGGWTMSMAWMRMPGQGWLSSAATFIGMWALMMIEMMMPVFLPEAVRFRRASEAAGRDRAAMCFAAGYFGVWIAVGIAIFPLGVAFAELAMRSDAVSRATPLLGAVVVMLAGVSQFTGWKLRQLARCRHEGACCRTARAPGAFRAGARLGQRCVACCAGLTAVLLVIGVMDLLAMGLLTAAICGERLLKAGAGAARLTGAALLVGGAAQVLRAST